MNATRSKARAGASHRLAMPLRVGRNGMARMSDAAQTPNEGLIFCCHDVAAGPPCRGYPPAFVNHALEAASHRKNPGFEHGGGVAMRGRLNAFFAISVNSPSMSMVNVSCCVCSASSPGARGVTRRVTPQPMRAAVRMEAGADACV